MNKRDKALQLIKELEDNQDRPISPNLKENLENLTLLTEGCSDIVDNLTLETGCADLLFMKKL
ncbi:hypothetical protein DXY22_01469 [Bacillus subtilis]|nr:hypothetical protein DXY22_01469 [Bacillus subtilis]